MQASDENLVSWAEIVSRLAAARNYWLGTTTLSGAPHAVPVWGVFVGETLHIYTERRTVKARNISSDSRVVIHLESGEDVLIVRGTAVDIGMPSDVPSVVAALAAKYTAPGDEDYLPVPGSGFDVVYAIKPVSAIMWSLADYDGSQRSWTSDTACR